MNKTDILIVTKVTRKLKGKKIKSKSKKFRFKKYTKVRLFRNCYPEFSDLGKSEVSSSVDTDGVTVGITFKYQVPVAPKKITLNFQIPEKKDLDDGPFNIRFFKNGELVEE